MEKEFVPYELALRMKQLGFDQPCMASKDMNNDKGLIQLPLYQQAFRWFREKYDLDSEIYMNHELGVKFYTYLILQLERAVITHKLGYTGRFDTYEEAELACLTKLIEIVE